MSGHLRAEVRDFLAAQDFTPRCDSWLGGFDSAFSRRLAQRGWVGMALPRRYGGSERTMVERHAVLEELLAAGAPVAAHWVADRQSGPLLMRYGTDSQRERLLPGIAAGETYFCIGMSEPDAGSDLASIRTRAERVPGGWTVSGTKVWTSHAHRSRYMLTLVRTSREEDRHAGLSQLIVALDSPGVDVRAIPLLTGEHHFNEVILDEVFVPDDMVVGHIGDGWKQVISELALERSGPERFLSTYPLHVALLRELGVRGADDLQAERVGRATARLATLRTMSCAIAAAVQAGESVGTRAALVKAAGTAFEIELIEEARTVGVRSAASTVLLREAVLSAPGFTLRGGTTEMLQTIVARELVGRA